jgi:glucosamine--fructose-6-phosphate aminotransferase (isomerizing)
MALIDEIRAQPSVVPRFLRESGESVDAACRAIREADPTHVVIAARGTSDHAAIYAQYALGVHARLSVGLATPSVQSLYGVEPRMDGALVIGISQSGASPDIVGVVAAARRQNAVALAITNTPESDLAAVASHVIDLRAGPERAVAATKTYSATLVALAALTAGLAEGRADDGADLAGQLAGLPAALATVLETEDEVRRIAADQAGMDRCVVLGRGYHYATAREWALKLKELGYVLADPYSAADFRHGPLALIEAGFPALVVAPSGATAADMGAIIERVGGDLGATVLVVSDDADLRARGAWSVALPGSVPEWLMPIVAIVPGQLHALHVTLTKGRDPESPRSIGKVTRTR